MEYQKPIIILRKKIEGENSIEELSNSIKDHVDIKIITCPYSSTSILGILKNILFIRSITAPVCHIMTPSEGYLLPFIKSKKRIITYHDLGTIYKSRNKLYQYFRVLTGIVPSKYFADAITFVSNQTLSEYLHRMHIKKQDKLYVIYNAYDSRLKYTECEPNKIFTVLHIGTSKRKNLIGTIKAMKGLNAKLNIIGKLSAEQYAALDECQINFENSYDVTYEKIVESYNQCDIVSFPTFYEGFGMPIIEANIMHKPIFASDINIIKEIGQDSVYYVNPNDIDSIKTAITTLMNNSDIRKEYIERGLKNAERFDPNVIYKQYGGIYSNE